MCTATSFWDSNIFAALIGGLIGFFSSLITSVWYSNHQNKILKYEGYRAWCNGVQAEINHLLAVINEIEDILNRLNVPSTKRLNYDYLEQARIKVIDYEDDLEFLQTLTNAYRDIVHTNDMLDRLERDFESQPTFIHNVISSMAGVKASISSLNTNLQTKIQVFRKH